jgi:hypothetical protein
VRRCAIGSVGKKVRKDFFFVKKKQKTFINWLVLWWVANAQPIKRLGFELGRVRRFAKVFWFFLQKKNCLLSF